MTPTGWIVAAAAFAAAVEQKGVSYLQHDVPEVHLGMDD